MTTMIRYIAIFILISFVGLAAFSVVAFDHKIMVQWKIALIPVDGTPCPTNLVASIIHHTAAFQALFNTLIPSLILFLISVSVVFLDKNLASPKLLLYQKLKILN